MPEASIMMAKEMIRGGYEIGKGLGHNLQEMIEPIEFQGKKNILGLEFQPTVRDKKEMLNHKRAKKKETREEKKGSYGAGKKREERKENKESGKRARKRKIAKGFENFEKIRKKRRRRSVGEEGKKKKKKSRKERAEAEGNKKMGDRESRRGKFELKEKRRKDSRGEK